MFTLKQNPTPPRQTPTHSRGRRNPSPEMLARIIRLLPEKRRTTTIHTITTKA